MPDGERLIVFGDIHGQDDMLDDLLARIGALEPPTPGLRDRYVFLGDYIDRGPNSARVIDRLCDLRDGSENAVFLMGNHEDMMMKFLLHGDTRAGGAWMANGGEETLASYGVAPSLDPVDVREFSRCRQQLGDALPDRHRRFYADLLSHKACGPYMFVHAGVRPGVALDAQRDEDMMWIRRLFLDSTEDFGAIVVHGHTPADRPEVKSNRINLDTGAGKGGYLTAAVLWGTCMTFLHAGDWATSYRTFRGDP